MSLRYRPMHMPSAPFWLMLIAVVIFASVIAATWSVVFMFAIGLALFAVLLPVVNWLVKRGIPRGLASLAVVAVLVIVAILVGLFAIAVFFNQLLPFFASIPGNAERDPVKGTGLAGQRDTRACSTPSATRLPSVDPAHIALGFLTGILGLVRHGTRSHNAAVLHLLPARRSAAHVDDNEGARTRSLAALRQAGRQHLREATSPTTSRRRSSSEVFRASPYSSGRS